MRHHEVEFEKLKGSFVKIDPPEYASCYVDEIGSLIQPYKELLQQMEELADVTFLNHPKGILQTLDKAACKKTLKEAQVPVTPVIAQGVTGYLTLKELFMCKKDISCIYQTQRRFRCLWRDRLVLSPGERTGGGIYRAGSGGRAIGQYEEAEKTDR